MMNPDDNTAVLQPHEFTQAEIKRLLILRQALWEKQVQQAIATYRRLEFIRWLVKIRRLTE